MFELKVKTSKKNEMVDITTDIQQLIENNNISKGYAIIFVPHTTAAITINEGADPSVREDIINSLNKLVPNNGNYSHYEGNSDAHIKASLIGPSIILLINNKKVILGTWQHIFFFEGDGPRDRKVLIEIFQ
jgi:secondary thiamine-phosphate synthase enzyme